MWYKKYKTGLMKGWMNSLKQSTMIHSLLYILVKHASQRSIETKSYNKKSLKLEKFENKIMTNQSVLGHISLACMNGAANDFINLFVYFSGK